MCVCVLLWELQNQKHSCYVTEGGHVPFGSIEKVFKQVLIGREQIVTFQYCSEITFKKGEAGS